MSGWISLECLYIFSLQFGNLYFYNFKFFSVEFPLFTKLDGFKGTAKYPQLSQKIIVQDSKKKGRHLVAREKINPGRKFFKVFIVSWVCVRAINPKR